ncbi:hypothetical protein NUW54_g11260 [Trametes sanguinea]|uniref:Uncharacterized protein n=1 Tax=Trametes sanguinea TaxID=158606 RepID=A0ACC1NH48_9APHY|nr:hypothetical protein NUW54_g11260 [Trametes sanguinea]
MIMGRLMQRITLRFERKLASTSVLTIRWRSSTSTALEYAHRMLLDYASRIALGYVHTITQRTIILGFRHPTTPASAVTASAPPPGFGLATTSESECPLPVLSGVAFPSMAATAVSRVDPERKRAEQSMKANVNDLDDVFGSSSATQSIDQHVAKGAMPTESVKESQSARHSAAKIVQGWDSDDEPIGAASSDHSTHSTPAVGRISNTTLARVRSAYEVVLQLAKDVRDETGLSTGQVFDQWFMAYAGNRTSTKANMWNLYNVYFKEHTSEELARISLDRKKPSFRELCYAAFKAHHGEKAQEILTTFQGIQQVADGLKQTVAQRTRAFKSCSSRVTNLLDSFEDHHGFSAALVLVGNSVNSDGHLATVHTTRHAERFFEDKCRATTDTIIGHMKAHVYHQVSQVMVSSAWEDERQAGKSTTAKVKQKASEKETGVASQHHPNAVLQAGTSSARPTASSPTKLAQPEDDEDLLVLRKDKPKYICQKLRNMLGEIGVQVNASLFPWKMLAHFLAANGVWMDNWPDNVPWPGESVSDPTKSRKPTKGITTLKSAEINALLAALKAPVHRIRVHKCQDDHEKLGFASRPSPGCSAGDLWCTTTIDIHTQARSTAFC